VDENTGTTRGETIDYTELTAGLVSAYVANNSVPATELAALIATTHAALTGLGNAGAPAAAPAAKTTPAQIRKSITHEGLISFEDGKPYKTLKRHLTKQGLTPEGYREKWGLPRDYPMTAASYSEARSALARSAGLGQQRRGVAPKVAEAAETAAEKPKSARRSRKGEGSASA
jgi:predicted transcriptional regulator